MRLLSNTLCTKGFQFMMYNVPVVRLLLCCSALLVPCARLHPLSCCLPSVPASEMQYAPHGYC